ncbi:hypothetical protein [Salinicoccus sp. CNSTN-B1]
MTYRVYDVDDSVTRRQNLNDKQIKNLDNLLKLILENDSNPGQHVLYELPKETQVDTDKEEHFLKVVNDKVFNNSTSDEEINEICTSISQKLHKAELVKTKEGYRRNKNITQGILIIKFFEDKLVLMKLEETESIDKKTFEILNSLSLDKNYYKVCLFKKDDYSNIRVIDKNKVIAKYWATKFLKLERKRDNTTNTLHLIEFYKNDELLSSELNVSPRVRKSLNNQILNFLSTSKEFDTEELFKFFNVNDKDLLPVHNYLNREIFCKIDTEFEIDKDIIDSGFEEKVKVTNNITITSKNLRHDILAEKIKYRNGELIITIPDEYHNKVNERFGEDND